MKANADRSVCIGAGMCVLTAPEVFDQNDEDGTVTLIAAVPSADDEAAVREAVRLCPSGAITVTN